MRAVWLPAGTQAGRRVNILQFETHTYTLERCVIAWVTSHYLGWPNGGHTPGLPCSSCLKLSTRHARVPRKDIWRCTDTRSRQERAHHALSFGISARGTAGGLTLRLQHENASPPPPPQCSNQAKHIRWPPAHSSTHRRGQVVHISWPCGALLHKVLEPLHCPRVPGFIPPEPGATAPRDSSVVGHGPVQQGVGQGPVSGAMGCVWWAREGRMVFAACSARGLLAANAVNTPQPCLPALAQASPWCCPLT